MLSDNEFVKQLEAKTLDPVYFNHIGHLRLAWLYLSRHDFERAYSLVDANIRAYADSLGETDKYHVTITYALMRIIEKRIKRQNSKTFKGFLETNSDIIDNAVSVLCEYFTKDKLFSDQAKSSLLQPDLKSL